jgi:3-phenylpropionate/trans-cinnamate dioxygenase ferredoxin reductase subunit
MTDPSNRVVIVGAGHAGGWVALTIRQHQPDRPITLIGDEDHPPYERPPLSKDVLLGSTAAESTYLRPLVHYGTAGIELRLGTRAVAIDRAARLVRLRSGDTVPYDTLVLATGSRPRMLAIAGADHPRVRTLRAIDDLEPIRGQLAEGREVVAIGAGFIGLEIAAAAVTAGARVTVLEMAPQALGRMIAPEVAAAIVRRHERRGVAFRFNAAVSRISDEGGRPVVHLSTGESFPADLVVLGVGGIPNDELAQEAGLACDDGILVDAEGRTSDPAIYAVGDIARHHSPALGRRVRLESWQNAQNQGIALGRVIAGTPEPWVDVPWFYTHQYQDNFQIIGVPARWDQIVWRGGPDEDKFTAIYLSDGLIVGGNSLNTPRDVRPLKQMIAERTRLEPAVLADTSVPLIKLQKLQDAQ